MFDKLETLKNIFKNLKNVKITIKIQLHISRVET